MNNQHPVDLLPGFALSVLDDDQARVVHAHVQECEDCQRELQELVLELTDNSAVGPRARVRRQFFGHIQFDMDMREALREGARRTSLRWIWGAFLLILGSIVASLLMWSGMQQREVLANERVPTMVATTDSALVRFLAQSDVESYPLTAKLATSTARMHLYYHTPSKQALFAANGLRASETHLVWLIDDIRATRLGELTLDDEGVAWLQTTIDARCIRCNIVVSIEASSDVVEPSNEWQFELIFTR